MAQLMVSWFICDGIFRVHAINPVGRRRGRIIEIEDVDSGERVHGTARRLERLVNSLRDFQHQHAAELGLRASLDVPIPAPMATNAFAVQLIYPPAFAIGTQPLPAMCECLGCLRVGQADRTPSLRASNLHEIPCAPASGRYRPLVELHATTEVNPNRPDARAAHKRHRPIA